MRLNKFSAIPPHSGQNVSSFEKLLFLHQNLRILVVEYNQVYGFILVSTKICFISFAMFGAYGAFRTAGALMVFIFSGGIFSTCFLVLYIVLLGEVHDRSKVLLSAARSTTFLVSKRRRDPECVLWLRKVLRSCREMKVEVGSAYFIDKPIVLTTFQILFDCTINFLLMTK